MSPTSTRFPAVAASVPRARQFVAAELGHLPPEVLDRALLMVSELATNAVIHAATEFEVTIVESATELKITVRDTGPGRPAPQNPAETEPHGRGLKVVSALSSGWGVVDLDGGGKAVWFSLRLVAPAPPGSLAATSSTSSP